ncbi:hypothetical protein GCM10027579_11670 [Calidifontibacter terrae]
MLTQSSIPSAHTHPDRRGSRPLMATSAAIVMTMRRTCTYAGLGCGKNSRKGNGW